jgi:hypothetical protein
MSQKLTDETKRSGVQFKTLESRVDNVLPTQNPAIDGVVVDICLVAGAIILSGGSVGTAGRPTAWRS